MKRSKRDWKEMSFNSTVLKDIYQFFQNRYSISRVYGCPAKNKTLKICGRKIRLRSVIILSTLLVSFIVFVLLFRKQLTEFRFTPQQFLGYRHCSSVLNKENIDNFNRDYPCQFTTPIPNKDGVAVVTFVNSGWINMTKNWICSAKKVGLGDNILLVTVEPDVCAHFPEVPCHYEKGSSISGTKFGQPDYQKFMIERTKITLRLLSCNIKKLVLSDADVVFLKNPIGPLEKELGTQDIVLQRDSTGVSIVDSIAYNLFHYICGGFIYMSVNDNTKLLYQSILQFQTKQSWNDQAGLNVCIRHYSLNVNWNLLPVPLFPNGKAFFEFGSDPSLAVIVHANFKSGSIDKTVNMMLRGIWCREDLTLLLCKQYIMDKCMKKSKDEQKHWCNDFKNLCLKKVFQ